MKKLYYISAVFLFFMLISPDYAMAQGKGKGNGKGKGKGHVTSKKHGPPPWAPAHGYRAKTRYVYFKDYDVYYDHDRGVYISLSGKNWSVSAKLPTRLASVNLTNAVKVDIDLSVDDPQRYYRDHLKKYPKRR